MLQMLEGANIKFKKMMLCCFVYKIDDKLVLTILNIPKIGTFHFMKSITSTIIKMSKFLS